MVAPRCGEGRAFSYKQLPALEIADDFKIPTCDACSEMFISAALAKRVDADWETANTSASLDIDCGDLTQRGARFVFKH
jgi:hypothetical protein